MRSILLSACMALFFGAQAQVKEAKVTYERTIQMQQRNWNQNPDADNRPRTRTDRYELSFTSGQSLWEALPDMNAGGDEGGGNGGGNFMMRFGGGDDVTYTNFETGKRVDQRELNSKNYIVEDSIQKLKWKLSGDSKTILGYKAQKATAERFGTRMMMTMENGEMKRQQVADTSTVTAWFTLQIPVPAGPEFQGQLPGLILELEMNNGRMLYKAVEVSPKVNVSAIKEPKGGKRIAAADFTKEREKVMEEMRRNMPNGGRMRMNGNGN